MLSHTHIHILIHTHHHQQFAKSGRSSCQKCNEKIAKGELRIKTSTPGPNDYNIEKSYHVQCFTLPKKYTSGSGKITVEDFVKDILEDASPGGEILPAMTAEIVAKMETKPEKKKAAESLTLLETIKTEYEQQKAGSNDTDEPASKKAKSTLAAQVDAYEQYMTCK